MRVAAQTVGIVAVVPAFWFLVQAVWTPFRYALATASAPQITQVYAEGSYDALPAPALFALAGLCLGVYARLTPLDLE